MSVTRLKTRKRIAEETNIACLRQVVAGSVAQGLLPEVTGSRITTILDRLQRSRTGWSFVMVDPVLNSAVVDYLTEHSRRPLKALRLWAALFKLLPDDSNEVMATRQELAEMVGVEPGRVSEMMGELEAVGAAYRIRDGRGVRYFVHPKLGTHLSGAVRDRAQAEAPPLKFALRAVVPAKPVPTRRVPLSVVPS